MNKVSRVCVRARARVCVRVESGRIHGATVTHFNESDRTSDQKVSEGNI